MSTPRLHTRDGSYVYLSIIWFGSIRVDLRQLERSTIFIGSISIDLSRIEPLPMTVGSNEIALAGAVRRQVQSQAPSLIFARNLVTFVSVEPSILPLSIALVQNAGAENPSDSGFSFFLEQIPASGSIRRSGSNWNPWNFFEGSTRTPRLPTGDGSYVYSSIIWFGSIRVDLRQLERSTIFIGSISIDLSRIEPLPMTVGSNEIALAGAVRRQVQSQAPSLIFARNLVTFVSVEPSILPLSIALVQNVGAENPSDSGFSFFSEQLPVSGSTLAPSSLPQTTYTSHINQGRANHSPSGSNTNPRQSF